MRPILIGGVSSGVGKTSICLGIVRAMARRGLRVQTFKVGPDYLDPTYLALASGRPCYNLDPWMSSEQYVRQLFQRVTADADVAVVEGVMGLFDGADATSLEGSSAHVAKLLDADVWLVANAHGMSRSLAAMVRGYSRFEEGVRIAGVIANQAGSERHGQMLADALQSADEPPLLGCIGRGTLPELQSRHLGLKTASSGTISMKTMDRLADAVEGGIPRLGQLFAEPQRKLATDGAQMDTDEERCGICVNLCPICGDNLLHRDRNEMSPVQRRTTNEVCVSSVLSVALTLAVARDEAFHFYYQDNLDALEAAGCRIVYFSPLADAAVPDDADAIYLGGGYPEEFANQLEANAAMRESVRDFAAGGRLVYAECGGLMYLAQAIESGSRRHAMCGVLPGICVMGKQRRRLGYASVTFARDCVWGMRGDQMRGHEFHYSDYRHDAADGWQDAYQIEYRRGESGTEGWHKENVMASYVHLHWASRPAAVEHFVASMRKAARCGH